MSCIGIVLETESMEAFEVGLNSTTLLDVWTLNTPPMIPAIIGDVMFLAKKEEGY